MRDRPTSRPSFSKTTAGPGRIVDYRVAILSSLRLVSLIETGQNLGSRIAVATAEQHTPEHEIHPLDFMGMKSPNVAGSREPFQMHPLDCLGSLVGHSADEKHHHLASVVCPE